jgi:hypothetical protein
MSFGSALVAIVAIIAFTVIRITRHRTGFGDRASHLRHGRPGHDLPSPREEQLTREVEDLRDRIAVLERIATEDRHGKAVAAEIESLREK